MKLKMSHIELFCRDPAATARWWMDKLGATLVADQSPFQWIEIGGQEILLRPGNPKRTESYRASDLAIVFSASSLEDVARRLTAAEVIHEHGDGDECLTLQDHDGHWIQIAPET